MIKSIISKVKKCACGNEAAIADKVVCGCFNVSEKDIKNAVNNGALSFEDVQNATKVGTGCGNCVDSNRAFVNNLLLDKKLEENQIICGCFKVTVQDLANAVKNGAKSFEEVQKITKVGTGCGGCLESNKALVPQLIAKY